MSKISELAEREAAAAEAEDAASAPETLQVPESEPDETPEPEPEPDSAAKVDDVGKQFEREHERHEKALRKIMGDDFDILVRCELCWTDGYRMPAEVGALSFEQANAVRAAIGDQLAPELRQNAETVKCERCGGWGDLLSGALVERARTMQCPDCGGQGYRHKAPEPPPLTPMPPPVVTGNGSAVYVPPGAPEPPQPYYDYGSGTWKLPGT